MILFYLLKLFDKKINNHDLDVVLTPSWQVLFERIILILLFSFILSIIISFEMVDYYNEVSTEDIDIKSLEKQYVLLIFVVIYSLVISYIILLWNCAQELNIWLCGRKIFYIELQNGKWEIEKAHSKNTLYLKRENKKFKYTYEGNIEIFYEQKLSQNVKNFFEKLGNVKYYRIGAVILYVAICIGNFVVFIYAKNIILIVLIVSFLLLALLFNFMFGFNNHEKEREKIKEVQSQK